MAWVNIGTLARVPRNGAYLVPTPEGQVTIFRKEDDTLVAWRDPRDGSEVQDYVVRCSEGDVLLFVPYTPSRDEGASRRPLA